MKYKTKEGSEEIVAMVSHKREEEKQTKGKTVVYREKNEDHCEIERNQEEEEEGKPTVN